MSVGVCGLVEVLYTVPHTKLVCWQQASVAVLKSPTADVRLKLLRVPAADVRVSAQQRLVSSEVCVFPAWRLISQVAAAVTTSGFFLGLISGGHMIAKQQPPLMSSQVSAELNLNKREVTLYIIFLTDITKPVMI